VFEIRCYMSDKIVDLVLTHLEVLMNNFVENPNKYLQKAPRLNLGKNACQGCNKDFIVTEHEFKMPGTQDLESVTCPYCNAYNGEVFINGTVLTRKFSE
jgi:hypothetical protein